jgi:hypothetical protein
MWSPELINCLIVHICGFDLGTDSGNHNLWEMIAIPKYDVFENYTRFNLFSN